MLTKYITAPICQENDVSRAFLELIDECFWCWSVELRDIINVLSIEDMDLETLIAYFEAYNVRFRSDDGDLLNRYSLMNWFNIMHSRGMLKTLEAIVTLNGELTPDKIVEDIELYNKADVPYDVSATPQDGYIYAVTNDSNIDIRDNDLLNQVTPAGYRIFIIKQRTPVITKAMTRILRSSNRQRANKLISCTDIDLSSIKEKNILFYQSPQFYNSYNFTSIYENGYSIKMISELNSTYNCFSKQYTSSDVPEPVEENYVLFGVLSSDYSTDVKFEKLPFGVIDSVMM